MRAWLALTLAWSIDAWAAERPVLAVFDIEDRGSGAQDRVVSQLSEYLAVQLVATGAFDTIPRAEIKQRLGAQKAESYKACYDQSCQIEIGRELAASKSLASQLMRLGKSCILTATIYDLRRNTTESAATVKGGCGEDDLADLVEKLVLDLSGAKTAAPVPAAATITPPPPSPPPPSPPPPAPLLEAGPLVWIESPFAKVQFNQTEITVAQYNDCVNAGACERTAIKDLACNSNHNNRGNYPMNCVSWFQATKFCTWAGGRLPTEEEWSAEASAGNQRPFVWGAEEASCQRAVVDINGDGCGTNSTMPVCSKPAGNSASGLCDLTGNVWEWSATHTPKQRIVRGGSYINEVGWATKVTARYTYDASARFEGIIGFRCVK